MKEAYESELSFDEESRGILVEEECAEIKPIIKEFVKGYAEHSDQPIKTWLVPKMQEQLHDREIEEIEAMADEILVTLEVNEEKKASLRGALANGRSKESWFASEAKKATSAMSAQEAAKYLEDLDAALWQANQSFTGPDGTMITKAGTMNQNPRLDGFLAEQYHVQTFNLNAKASGSQYRAKVLEPDGTAYTKNSVDIVIVDGSGKVVRRYQSKYYKDAAATEKAFEHGDYRGQRKLVPEGQKDAIQKKAADVLEAPDGTTSNPLSKAKAEQMRDEAQSGQWNDLNWNEYAVKDLAQGIGRQAGQAALQGAAIGAGFYVAQKLWDGEEIDAEEVVESAIVSGADFGVKAAAAGALKVGVEKEVIKVIPKGTPAGTIANIAHVAIENVKVLGEIASGELTMREGVDKLEQTTVSTTAGIMAMGKGAGIGASIGSVFGPVGAAVGGFIGGAVGYMAGSKVGETVVKCAQKVRDVVVDTAKTIVSGVHSVVSTVCSGVASVVGGIASLFGF